MWTEKDLSDSFFRQNVTTIHKYTTGGKIQKFWHQVIFQPEEGLFILFLKINRKENSELLPNAACRLSNVG